nr:FAD binding domain protein [Aspergillus sp. MF297-2]
MLGDIIGLSGNSMRILAEWNNGSLAHLIDDDITCDVTALELFDAEGHQRLAMPYNANDPNQGYLFRRTGLLTKLCHYASQLGIDLRFGVNVDGYWETDSSAGVYANNEKITGDCVVAADGFHSKARAIITGETPAPEDIGVVAYRSIFDADAIADVPEAQWILKKAQTADIWHTYYAKDTMVAIGTAARGRYVHWGCAGALEDRSESWMQPAAPYPVLKCLESWPVGGQLAAAIARTPPGKCFQQALRAIPPLKRWVSTGGRMIVIGDAAHSFLPYAGQGGNQAIEDAAVLGICLELAGTPNVPLALRVVEKLRHGRVSLIQKGSVEAGDCFLDAAWESDDTAERPTAFTHQAWVYAHNCVEHAYKQFHAAAEAVINGREYTPTNVPTDGKFRQQDGKCM